jgi:xanthine dehydrogenase accessory factor
MMDYYTGKCIYKHLVKHIEDGKKCILTTVVKAQGSTPQNPGSSAIFDKDSLLKGTVGGGVVEFKIQKEATNAVVSGKSGYFRYDMNDEISKEDAAICGGDMHILLDAAPEKHISVFKALAASYAQSIQGILITRVHTAPENDTKIKRTWITANDVDNNLQKFDGELKQKITAMLNKPYAGKFLHIGPSGSLGKQQEYLFLESIVPRPGLWIAGAGHVGKALVDVCKLLDFEITVWDDREEYANQKNIPDADKVMAGDLKSTFGQLTAQPDTFIVIVTRNHKNDAEVLKHFIASDAGYIGMIGSKKKIKQLKEQSLQEGWATPEQWENIHAPIGLDIHSKTVPEIAVSIAAQIIQEKNRIKYGQE